MTELSEIKLNLLQPDHLPDEKLEQGSKSLLEKGVFCLHSRRLAPKRIAVKDILFTNLNDILVL